MTDDILMRIIQCPFCEVHIDYDRLLEDGNCSECGAKLITTEPAGDER